MMISDFAGQASIAALGGETDRKNIALHTLKALVELITQMEIPRGSRPSIAHEVEQWVRTVVTVDHDGIIADLAGDLPHIISLILSN